MLKLTVSSVLIAAIGASAYANKDALYETYLQTQVNKSLYLIEGNVSYCGYTANENESPFELVNRVKAQFHGPKVLDEMRQAYREILGDTPEIAEWNEKINMWGWRSDEGLASDIKSYEGSKYLSDYAQDLKKIQRYRETSEFTKEAMIAKRDALRDAVHFQKGQAFALKVSEILEQSACELDDDSLIHEADRYLAILDRKSSEETRQTHRDAVVAQMQQWLPTVKEPLEIFTKQFQQLINDAFFENTIVDTKTVIEETSLTNTLTVATANALGRKKLLHIGCKASGSGFSPKLSAAQLSECFVRPSDDPVGTEINLYQEEIQVEEANDPTQWDRAKAIFMKELQRAL